MRTILSRRCLLEIMLRQGLVRKINIVLRSAAALALLCMQNFTFLDDRRICGLGERLISYLNHFFLDPRSILSDDVQRLHLLKAWLETCLLLLLNLCLHCLVLSISVHYNRAAIINSLQRILWDLFFLLLWRHLLLLLWWLMWQICQWKSHLHFLSCCLYQNGCLSDYEMVSLSILQFMVIIL